MNTATVFSYLQQHNLLTSFLKQEKVLQELEKEELLVIVEQLLNPTTTTQVTEPQLTEPVVDEQLSNKFVVDNNYRQNTIKYDVQGVLNQLQKDGVSAIGSFSKNDVNKAAHTLDLIVSNRSAVTGRISWLPSSYGQTVGVTHKLPFAVWYSLEAYEMIKDYLMK